jgi:hypothetical protein
VVEERFRSGCELSWWSSYYCVLTWIWL